MIVNSHKGTGMGIYIKTILSHWIQLFCLWAARLTEPRHYFCSCVIKSQAGDTAFPLHTVTTLLQAYLMQKDGILKSRVGFCSSENHSTLKKTLPSLKAMQSTFDKDFPTLIWEHIVLTYWYHLSYRVKACISIDWDCRGISPPLPAIRGLYFCKETNKNVLHE